MRLLLLQGGLRDEHGEVAVLHAQLLDAPVEELLDGLPDGVGPGPQHVAAADVVVLDHLRFGDHLDRGTMRQLNSVDTTSRAAQSISF